MGSAVGRRHLPAGGLAVERCLKEIASSCDTVRMPPPTSPARVQSQQVCLRSPQAPVRNTGAGPRFYPRPPSRTFSRSCGTSRRSQLMARSCRLIRRRRADPLGSSAARRDRPRRQNREQDGIGEGAFMIQRGRDRGRGWKTTADQCDNASE